MPTFETTPLSSVEKSKNRLPLWLIIIIILTLAVSASVLWYVFTHKLITPAAPQEKFRPSSIPMSAK
jgi:flagellar basal body-associated protein FliL